MNKTTVLTIGAIVLLAGIWNYRESVAQEAAAPAGHKIGVVNIADVLTQCKENRDREAAVLKKKDEIDAEFKALGDELRLLEQELQTVLQPGSPGFEERLDVRNQKAAWYEKFKQAKSQALDLETLVWLSDLYEKMNAEISRVANMKGLPLVLDKDNMDLKPKSLQELYNLIRGRKVLYSAPTIDISNEVLQNLDQAYYQSSNPAP